VFLFVSVNPAAEMALQDDSRDSNAKATCRMKIAICENITVKHSNYCQPQKASANRKGLDHHQQNTALQVRALLKAVRVAVQ